MVLLPENDPVHPLPQKVYTGKPTYWLTRFVLLRLLGVVYAVGFLVAINQLLPLIGSHGLLPVGHFLDAVTRGLGSQTAGFFRLPSVFWFWHSDAALLTIAWTGFFLSCLVIAGFANMPVMFVLWSLYLSIVHVGQDWYAYGWEIQLTETGFLAIFLCPLLDLRPFPRTALPFQVIVLFRWLVFRIMMGSGLIKIRWDEAWRNGTALYFHFETQPIPGPFSRWFHFLPRSWLKTGVWFNFLAELVAPLFAFSPAGLRNIAGIVMILFQFTIILSGNLSFLNWLTIIPALACIDDSVWSRVLPAVLVRKAEVAQEQARASKPLAVTAWVVTGIIVLLSIQPAINLVSPGQIMNTSFDPLDLVNTYGAFGTVGRERLNVVFEGTYETHPDENTRWIAYPYKGLPVATNGRPPQIAPYQLHFDWQMWFAAMSTPDEYPWVYNLMAKMMRNDPAAVSLFAKNPFAKKPPAYLRAVLYRYSFVPSGSKDGRWWNRERIGDWIPPVSRREAGFIE